MKLRITVTMAAMALSAAATAATSPLPAQILCTPDEHHRVGTEKLNLPGSEAFLFERGGKVTITTSGTETHYEYGKGQVFDKLKEKTAFSKDFIDMQQDIFPYVDPGWGDSSGFLDLAAQTKGSYFHIDWTKQRFYGYAHSDGAINAYAGSCTILKNKAPPAISQAW